MISLLTLKLAISANSAWRRKNDLDGHAVAAVIVDRNGFVVAWSVNTNTVNPVLHAEINALHALGPDFDWPEPPYQVVTSLKPCAMCAAAIVEVVGENLGSVCYAMRDPTQDSTVLEEEHEARDNLVVFQPKVGDVVGDLCGRLDVRYEALKEKKKAEGSSVNAALFLDEEEVADLREEIDKLFKKGATEELAEELVGWVDGVFNMDGDEDDGGVGSSTSSG